MPETPETSGGEIEHEVFLFSNLILLIIEMKFTLKNAWDCFAQVLLELVCEIFSFIVTYSTSDYIDQAAMKLNRDRDLNPQPPIYAMLSDLRNFYFLSYDGTTFQCMAQIEQGFREIWLLIDRQLITLRRVLVFARRLQQKPKVVR